MSLSTLQHCFRTGIDWSTTFLYTCIHYGKHWYHLSIPKRRNCISAVIVSVLASSVVDIKIGICCFSGKQHYGARGKTSLETHSGSLYLWSIFDWSIDLLCLTPLSAIFQLYHGDQSYWWKKPEYPERTTDHGQATGKLYYLRLRVECTLFVIYKFGSEPMPYWW
jgi:hypothetical protein